MIRKLLNGDIDRVADIWLKTNLKAHYFISNQYWKSNYELVKEMMSQYEVYVFEADKMIQGFVGLNDEYIEGIFVSDEMQSCGIGKLLLDYIKDKKVRLQLNVYQKNARAISFYQREGFIIQCEGLDEATGEKEYTMLWKQKQKSAIDDEKEYMKLYFNDTEIPVIWEDNQTVQELMEEARKGDVIVQMAMYSDNEQVGSLEKFFIIFRIKLF